MVAAGTQLGPYEIVAPVDLQFEIHKDKFPHAPAELRLSVIQIPAQPESLADA